MNNPIDDGGPAFPVHQDCGYTGMTLRDWFAGMALSGILSSGSPWAEAAWKSDPTAAEWSFKLADAMITESNRKMEGEQP